MNRYILFVSKHTPCVYLNMSQMYVQYFLGWPTTSQAYVYTLNLSRDVYIFLLNRNRSLGLTVLQQQMGQELMNTH